MKKEAFERDVVFALYLLFDWIEQKNRWDLFQNPQNNSKQAKEIRDRIYNIYSFDFSYHTKVNNTVEQEIKEDLSKELKLFKSALSKAAEICGYGFKHNLCAKLTVSSDRSWFFSGTKGSESIESLTLKSRIYLNIQSKYLTQFIEELIREFPSIPFPIIFKFASPFTITEFDLMRPETVVLYFPENSDLQTFLKFLIQRKTYFNKEVSLFTQKLMNGVSFAPHPTPKIQAYLEISSNSFGYVVAEIITRTILSFIRNYNRIPTREEFPKIANAVYIIIFLQAFKETD